MSPDATSGVVNFAAGLAPGASTYFALEESLTASDVQTGTGQSVVGIHEQGMAPNQWEDTITCSTSHPVNCATGEFWHTFTDLSIAGRGLPLSFARTYNSLNAAANGPLGYGWSFSYGMSLSVDASGNVTVTQGGGASVTFNPWYGGNYTAPSRVFATLVKNADGSYALTDSRTRATYGFSASGQLTSEADRNGETTALAYSNGELSTVTDPAGRQLALTYDGNGHIVKVVDPAGRSVSFTYDAAGDLASATDVAGGTTTFGYDANHLLTSMTDPRGGVTSNAYDASGRVVKQADPMDRVTTFAYSGDPTTAAGSTTTITDPRGVVTSHAYSQLELLSVSRGVGTPEPASWQYSYDPFTLSVAAVTDPDGHTTRYTYDRSGNVLSMTDPLGRTTDITYNSLNEPTYVSAPSGISTSFDYDGAGNLVDESRYLAGPGGGGVIADSTIRPAAAGTTTAVPASQTVTSGEQLTQLVHGDPAHPGDVTAMVDPNGQRSTFAYDVVGRRLTATSPRGNATGADPAAFTTSYSYDAFGDLTRTVDPLGHATSTTYDADRNPVSATDANGNTTTSVFDADNELTRVTRADGSALSYAYDADGNQVGQTDASGRVTAYAYDALNRVSSVTDPLNRVTSYGYDPAGNKTTVADPRGVISTLGYDAANELTSISYSDGTAPVAFTYTLDGQRASMSDATGTTTYSYDSLDRLTGQTNGAGQTVGYGYDLVGNVTSLTYPNNEAVSRSYDTAGRLTAITDWAGHTTAITPDADGDQGGVSYGNGVTTTSAFDATDHLAGITDTGPTGQALASFAYTRDANNQVLSEGTGALGQPTQTLGYNALNQLTNVNAAALAYDPTGNITSLPGGATASYDAASELTSVNRAGSATTYGYDAAGDRISASGGPDRSAAACGICILATSGRAALSASGTASITSSGVVTVDSTNAAAVTATGSARVVGTNVYVAGRAQTTGTATITPAAAMGSTPDPLQAVTSPTVTGTPSPLLVSGSSSATARPGVYTSIDVTGNARLQLAAGDYVLAGGDLTVSGSAAVTGTGVTIYLACSNYPDPCEAGSAGSGVRVSGNATLTLDGAADAGGVALASDAANNAAITVSGSPGAVITGHVHVPAAAVTVSGAGALKVDGTLVAATLNVTGSATVSETAPAHTLPGATYTYDAAHRLTGVKTPTTTAGYVYDGVGLRAAATTNNATQHFAWAVSGRMPLLLTDGSTSYLYDDAGNPVEQIAADGTPLYYQHDQLASTRALTDQTGAVVATYAYDAYGQVTAHTGSADTPLRFNGQYQDPTGLYYLRARYLDPATAQFLTVDPLAALTQQPHSYADDNPINAADPFGLSWYNPGSWHWKTIGKVAGYVGLGAGIVAIGVATFGVGDVALAGVAGIGGIAEAAGIGDVSVGIALDSIALGGGALSAGVDCVENWESAQCALDAASLGLGGGGLGGDLAGLNRWVGVALGGGSVFTGAGALFWPENDETRSLCP